MSLRARLNYIASPYLKNQLRRKRKQGKRKREEEGQRRSKRRREEEWEGRKKGERERKFGSCLCDVANRQPPQRPGTGVQLLERDLADKDSGLGTVNCTPKMHVLI